MLYTNTIHTLTNCGIIALLQTGKGYVIHSSEYVRFLNVYRNTVL